MNLQKYLWIQGQKYYLYDIYDDTDYEDLKKACERYRKRNGTKWYIRSFDVMSIFPETKHALYFNKTMNLNHKITRYKKDPNDNRWSKTKWQ